MTGLARGTVQRWRRRDAPPTRAIVLADWQRALTKLHPGALVQGLIHSDIRSIFTDHCAMLGVRVTQPNPRNLAVSHRDSVAILERVVGPKR